MADKKNNKDKDIAKIEPATLHEIHSDVKALLLKNFGINPKTLTIKMYVSEEQYNNLKENFPKTIHSDLIVVEGGSNWSVEILRWPYLEDEETNN